VFNAEASTLKEPELEAIPSGRPIVVIARRDGPADRATVERRHSRATVVLAPAVEWPTADPDRREPSYFSSDRAITMRWIWFVPS
jgi:hypothetical protein